MRVARWSWLVVLLACGGRTLADPPDEGAGAASSRGGSVGTGGRATTGGVPGAGGRPLTPPEACRGFCKELVEHCGAQLALGDAACRSNCEVGFGSSSACDALRVAAIGCVQTALAQPMASCADFSRILTQDCVIPLALSGTCR